MADKPLVLVADDELPILQMMEHHLKDWGYRFTGAANKMELLQQFSRETPDILLLDLYFGEHNGVEVMQELLSGHPDLAVVMQTGHGTIDNAVSAMKLGAYDYLTKPPDLNRLRTVLGHVVEKQKLSRKIKHLENLIEAPESRGPIWGSSPPIAHLRELIATVAPTDVTVLILGESGTGKELVARALHEQSSRRAAPFAPINMAALPRELVESTLFGHEKGSFTGADQSQIGCCEAADKGTLFLDEIGEMDPQIQAKLLRFLQEHTVQRVGASKPRFVDVRVLAASNQNLLERVRKGRFREDLYYRLNVVPIAVPPLRERRQDIVVLANRFLQRSAVRFGKDISSFRPDALRALESYSWPGNVRELENLVERLTILVPRREIGLDDLPPEIACPNATCAPASFPFGPQANGGKRKDIAESTAGNEAVRSIEQMEKDAIQDVLQRVNGNVRDAARLLGLGMATVYRKIKRYGIPLESTGRDKPPELEEIEELS
jgi:DNA-binding NtrC family response regulator